jgi:hypothetical protein
MIRSDTDEAGIACLHSLDRREAPFWRAISTPLILSNILWNAGGYDIVTFVSCAGVNADNALIV